MPVDDLLEFTLRTAIEWIIVVIFYWPGWLLLRVLTLGRYPPAGKAPHNRIFVGTFGFFACLIALIMCLPGARS
jgi:hypothetical protein